VAYFMMVRLFFYDRLQVAIKAVFGDRFVR